MDRELRLTLILNYIFLIATNLSSVVITPILTGGLGLEGYGIYVLVITTIFYFNAAEFSIGNIVVNNVAKYRYSGNKREEESFLFISLFPFLIIALLSVVFCLPIIFFAGSIFSETLNDDVISIFRQSFIIMAVNNFLLFFQNYFFSIIAGCKKFVFARMVLLIRLCIKISLIIIFMNLKTGAMPIYFTELFSTIVTIALFFMYAYGKLGVRIKYNRDIQNIDGKSILKNTLLSYSHIVSENIYYNGGNLIVGALCGAAEAGIFYIAITFAMIFAQLASTVPGYFIPKISESMTQDNPEDLATDIMIKVGRVLSVVLALMIVGFAAIGKDFILFWVGKDFIPAFKISLIMFLGLFFSQTQIVGDIIVQVKGSFGVRTLISVASTVCCIITSFIFISRYGLEFSFMGILVSAVVFRTLANSAYYYKMGIKMGRFYKSVYLRLLLVFLISGIELYLLSFVNIAGIAGVLVKGAAVVCLYIPSIWFIYLSREERKNLTDKLKNKITVKNA